MSKKLDLKRYFIAVGALCGLTSAWYIFSDRQDIADPSVKNRAEVRGSLNDQSMKGKTRGMPSADMKLEYHIISSGSFSSSKNQRKEFNAKLLRLVRGSLSKPEAELWLIKGLKFPDSSSMSQQEKDSIIESSKAGAWVLRKGDGKIERINGNVFWKGLIRQLNFAEPRNEMAWEQEEKGSFGLVNASYLQYSEADVAKHLKERADSQSFAFQTAYVLEQKVDDYPQPQLHVSQNCRGLFTAAKILGSLDCQQVLKLLHQNDLSIFNNWQSKLISWQPLRAADLELMNEKREQIDNQGPRSRDFAIHKKQLGEQRFDDFMPLLMSDSDESRSEKLQAYLALKAWIFLHPERLDEIHSLLLDKPEDQELFQNSLRALMGVGSSQAQDLMGKLLEDALSQQSDRSRAIMGAMALLDQPSIQTENRLREVANTHQDDDLKRAGMLALSAVGNQLKKQGDIKGIDRSETIEDELLTRLQSARTIAEKREILAYLGNLGSVSVLPKIEPFLTHQSSELRKAAVFSLRLIKSDQASSWLWSAQDDQEVRVRMEAVAALSYRDRQRSDLKRYQTWLAKEPSAKVRRNIVRQVIGFSDLDRDAVNEVLNSQLEKEADVSVRNLITNFQLAG